MWRDFSANLYTWFSPLLRMMKLINVEGVHWVFTFVWLCIGCWRGFQEGKDKGVAQSRVCGSLALVVLVDVVWTDWFIDEIFYDAAYAIYLLTCFVDFKTGAIRIKPLISLFVTGLVFLCRKKKRGAQEINKNSVTFIRQVPADWE